MTGPGSRFAYDPGVIRHGDGCVAALGDELASLDCERALVVTGRTVGQTPAVMDPVRDGLGDRLAGVFAETTPEKLLGTALDGAATVEARAADAVVAVGGGSTMDSARAIAALAARDLDRDAAGREFADAGTVAVPASTPPILVVPTTLSGADQSANAGLSADPDAGPAPEDVSGGIGDPALVPAAAFYDPAVVATTPRSVLAGSAMNGFDKGLEVVYSRHATPVTDATGVLGIGRFAEGLLAFADDYEAGVPAAVEGLLLVQFGATRGGATTFSLIHALGKFVAEVAGIQQGVGHAVVAPATLAAIFEAGAGRPELLADGLGVGTAADPARAVLERVTAVRDALGVPTRLREVNGVGRGDLPAVAADAADHAFAGNGPPGVEPTTGWFEGALEAAW